MNSHDESRDQEWRSEDMSQAWSEEADAEDGQYQQRPGHDVEQAKNGMIDDIQDDRCREENSRQQSQGRATLLRYLLSGRGVHLGRASDCDPERQSGDELVVRVEDRRRDQRIEQPTQG
jgi:hypothetical protein